MATFLRASTSHENTSQYQCTIRLAIDDNKEKHQIGDYCLVEKQIPKDKNCKKYVGKYVKFGKITIEILGVEGEIKENFCGFCTKNNMVTFREDFLGKEKVGGW